MPKISDARRAERRSQILEAAWIAFQRQGLHATTMDDIIRASGLSAGAVYSYFPSKDVLILAAVTTSLAGLGALLRPIVTEVPPPPPDEMASRICAALTGFTERDGYDLKRIALLGWSEAQRNEQLRVTMRGVYGGFRDLLAGAAAHWRAAGLVDPSATPEEIARALLALVLGFVVQSAIMADIEPDALARGMAAIGGRPQPPR